MNRRNNWSVTGKTAIGMSLGILVLLPNALAVEPKSYLPCDTSCQLQKVLKSLTCNAFGVWKPVTRQGGPVPEIIPSGSESGLGVKVVGRYLELAYFEYDSNTLTHWNYFMTGFTADPDISCNKVIDEVCEIIHDELDHWLERAIAHWEAGDLAKITPPPAPDPECASPV